MEKKRYQKRVQRVLGTVKSELGRSVRTWFLPVIGKEKGENGYGMPGLFCS